MQKLFLFRITTWFAGALSAAFICGSAHASTIQAKISNILVFSRGSLVYVYPLGGVVGKPACDAVGGGYYSFSFTRPMASAYLATLLAAKSTGAFVTLYGTGACTDQPISETLDYLRID